MNDWTDDIEKILENIRINSISLSNYHKEKYYYYKSYLKFFKLPLIILSSITSIASVGLTGYLEQEDISIITCLLSLASAIIASIELYLGIQKNMESEMVASRNFLILGYDVFKTLNLNRDHRTVNGKLYLDEKYNEYIKLVEQANLIHNKRIKDALAPVPKLYDDNSTIQSLPSTPTSNTTITNLEIITTDENGIIV
jgi:hypothetical protein